MLRRRPTVDDKVDELNMTPMIDVVFQLLIFFMLSMHFKEVEGKLLSQMPKDKGPDTRWTPPPELQEIRIVLCAGTDPREHLDDKARHEAAPKPAGPCRVFVDRLDLGFLYATETAPLRKKDNKAVYLALAAQARTLREALKGLPGPVILDADREVPYEHVIGAINALQEQGLERVEFAASPALAQRLAPR